MSIASWWKSGGALAVVLGGLGCAPQGEDGQQDLCGDAPQSSGSVTVTSDVCTLERQVDRTRQAIPIEPPAGDALRYVAAAKASTTTLTLLATVSPPVVGGATLQASGVTLKGDHAIVSYMLAGEPRAGGLDVIRTSDENNPVLISRATFTNADIIASDFDENYVWYVGGSADKTLPSPAFLGAIKLTGNKLDMSEAGTIGLSSYVGTSIAVSTKKRIYTTSGSGGAFAAFSYNTGKGSFTKVFDYTMTDARAVHWHNDRIGVVGGTAGTLAVFEEDEYSPLASYPFSGATLPDAKSGLEIAGKKAFIAAGPAGVQVLSIITGKLVGQVAAPDAQALGLDPKVVTTNGLAVDGDLLFICNGGAGITVAQGSKSFESSGSEDAQVITTLGRLGLGLSANHVAFRSNYLMIATGSGGLKIVKVETN